MEHKATAKRCKDEKVVLFIFVVFVGSDIFMSLIVGETVSKSDRRW